MDDATRNYILCGLAPRDRVTARLIIDAADRCNINDYTIAVCGRTYHIRDGAIAGTERCP